MTVNTVRVGVVRGPREPPGPEISDFVESPVSTDGETPLTRGGSRDPSPWVHVTPPRPLGLCPRPEVCHGWGSRDERGHSQRKNGSVRRTSSGTV